MDAVPVGQVIEESLALLLVTLMLGFYSPAGGGAPVVWGCGLLSPSATKARLI